MLSDLDLHCLYHPQSRDILSSFVVSPDQIRLHRSKVWSWIYSFCLLIIILRKKSFSIAVKLYLNPYPVEWLMIPADSKNEKCAEKNLQYLFVEISPSVQDNVDQRSYFVVSSWVALHRKCSLILNLQWSWIYTVHLLILIPRKWLSSTAMRIELVNEDLLKEYNMMFEKSKCCHLWGRDARHSIP